MNGKKLKVLELFAGTRSIGKAFEAKGHEVFSVEWDKDFQNIDLYADILNVSAEEIISKFGHPDVIWASRTVPRSVLPLLVTTGKETRIRETLTR